MDFASNSVNGSVTDGSFLDGLVANLDVFSARAPATNFDGRYTLVIPGVSDPTVGPYGIGYGTVKIAATGLTTFAGSLADGAPVTASSAISQSGLCPFYVPLYGGKGSYFAFIYFSPEGLVGSFHFPEALVAPSWINPGVAAPSALYRAGFTNRGTYVLGSFFASTNHPLLTDMNGAPTVLEGGGLAAAQTNTLAESGKVNDTNLVLTLNRTTGVLTGWFHSPTTDKLKMVNGVILQGQSNVAGYFRGTTDSGLFQLAQ